MFRIEAVTNSDYSKFRAASQKATRSWRQDRGYLNDPPRRSDNRKLRKPHRGGKRIIL